MSEPRQVLVVEDDLDLREILTDFLSAEGHDVQSVANGEEALRVLDDAPSDSFVILLDLMMPVLDGVTLLKMLETRQPAHRVVLVTADNNLRAELSSTVAGNLSKPFDVRELRAAIAANV